MGLTSHQQQGPILRFNASSERPEKRGVDIETPASTGFTLLAKFNFFVSDALRPRGYKTFSMLNSAKHEHFPAHKC